MTLLLNGTTVTWTGDAAQPGARAAFDVTLRATPVSVEQVLTSPFTAPLLAGDELRALRAMVRELAELVVEQAAEIEGLEAELEEGSEP